MKKFIYLLIVMLFCSFFTFPQNGKTQNEVKHYSVLINLHQDKRWINGTEFPSFSGFLMGGRFLMPHEFFKENFPVQITEEYSLHIINLALMYQDTDILFSINSPYVIVNGIEKEIDCFPFFNHIGQWLLPFRFIFETLGGEVGWDSETRDITVEIDL